MTSRNSDAAREFRGLHEGALLRLPNAWDAGSARLVEHLGAKAVATSSAAVAWAHGYADGDRLPVALLATTVAEIARIVRVPITADIEGGYAADPTGVGDSVAAIVDAGAVGINIEDGWSNPDLLCAKIEVAKRTAARLGVDLFVNARTDVYLHALAPEERRVDETLARANRYREAGADGIFVPGVAKSSEIETITSSIALPINVLAWPGLPDGAELESLGVRRLSAGSGIAQALFGRAAALVAGFLASGVSEPLGDGAMSYPEINALMADR